MEGDDDFNHLGKTPISLVPTTIKILVKNLRFISTGSLLFEGSISSQGLGETSQKPNF